MSYYVDACRRRWWARTGVVLHHRFPERYGNALFAAIGHAAIVAFTSAVRRTSPRKRCSWKKPLNVTDHPWGPMAGCTTASAHRGASRVA
jgi:hypothetical protein